MEANVADALYETGTATITEAEITSTLSAMRRAGYRITQTNLSIKSLNGSRPLTLSSRHGTGRFPLHTDFAFNAIPPRYIILANLSEQSFDRCTLLCDLTKLSRSFRLQMERSVWRLKTIRGTCLLDGVFKRGLTKGLRWDTDFLMPFNSEAEALVESIEQELTRPIAFNWTPKSGLIIDNWRLAHGRDSEPILPDYDRKLKRFEAWEYGRMVSR